MLYECPVYFTYKLVIVLVWQICLGSGEYIGTAASVPLVLESLLRHDDFGYSYDNGPFVVMERYGDNQQSLHFAVT